MRVHTQAHTQKGEGGQMLEGLMGNGKTLPSTLR